MPTQAPEKAHKKTRPASKSVFYGFVTTSFMYFSILHYIAFAIKIL